MQALVELALAVHESERESESVSPIVKAALKKHREEQQEAASNDIVGLLRKMESQKLQTRKSIRRLKAELKTEKAKLDDLDRRWAYAQQTANFLPVLAFFGMIHKHDVSSPEDFDTLIRVPSDWTPEGAGEE